MDVSKYIEKAREAAERRNYDYAIDMYLTVCKMVPDHPTARRELRAVENRKSKEKPPSFMDRAKIKMMQGQIQVSLATKKFDSAIEKAEDCLKIDPGHVGVLMMLGRALMGGKYSSNAIFTYEDIKTMGAGGDAKALVEALRELAYAYEGDNRIKEAMDAWTLVNRHNPGDRDATVRIRDLSAKTMSATIETAARSGERGAAARSTQSEAQKKEAAKLDREKSSDIKSDADLQASIEDAKEEIAKRQEDPRISQVYVKLGDLYKVGNSYADAKKAYEGAIERDKNNPSYTFKLHDLEIWRTLKALKALEVKKKAGDAAAKDQFLKDYAVFLDYRLTSFIEREKQYSTDSAIKFELGTVYFEQAKTKGDRTMYDEAIRRFQHTFQDPKFRIRSGLRMGQCFSAKGQFDLALKRYDETLKGMELKNEDWKTLKYEKGDTLQKSGKRDEAKATFLEIYEIDVSFRDIGKRVDDLSHDPNAQVSGEINH